MLSTRQFSLARAVQAGLLSLSATAVPSLAADNASSLQLEEVIVTAQGREQNLNDVPVAVSVVSGEMMKEFSLTSIEDVSDRMPNVSVAAGPLDVLSIRGIGSGANGGFQQSVGVYVDGAYRSRSRSIHAALFDIDRMEVLKGPQTTFFGANSVAGALSITSRAPSDEFDWNIGMLYGTDGEYSVEGGVDLPLSDTFKMRLAGRTNGMDGYIKTLEGDAPNTDNQQFRGSFSWDINDAWQSDFRIDYADSEAEGALAFQLVGCPVPDGYVSGTACSLALANNGGDIDDRLDHRSDTALDYVNMEYTEAVWTNTIDISDTSTLIFKTAYYEHESNSLFTGIPFPNDPQAPFPPFLGTLPGASDPFPVGFDEEFSQFSQEIRFQTDTGGFLDYMVGLYYDEQELDFLTSVNFFFNDFGFITENLVLPGFLAGAPAEVVEATRPLWENSQITSGEYYAAKQSNRGENETYSAFAAFTLRPTEDLTINIGGRYTRFEKFASRNSVRGRVDSSGNNFQQLNAADEFTLNLTLGGDFSDFNPNTRTDEDFMPSLSVQYDLTDDVMGYFSYSEGFKAGGYSTANNPDIFEPEYVDAFEVGIKGSFLDGRLRMNVAAFLNEFEDFQETVVISEGVTLVSVVKNAGKLKSQGIEFDGTYLLNDNLSVNMSLAYLDATYDEFENAPCNMQQTLDAGGSSAPCSQDLSGKTRGYAPEWSGSLSANWMMPLDAYTLTLSPVVYFSDDYFLDATADPWQSQDSFAKVDFRISLMPENEKWSLSLVGKNLTDETTASFSSTVTNSDGSSRQIVDRPRSVALQFNLRH